MPFHAYVTSNPELLQKAERNPHLQTLKYLDKPWSDKEPTLQKSMLSLSRVWTVMMRFLEDEEPSLFDSYSHTEDEEWAKVSLLEELREKYIYKLTRHSSAMVE